MSNSTEQIIDPNLNANLTASAQKSTDIVMASSEQEDGYWAGFLSLLSFIGIILGHLAMYLSYFALLLLGMAAIGGTFYGLAQLVMRVCGRLCGDHDVGHTTDGEELSAMEAGRLQEESADFESEEIHAAEECDGDGRAEMEKIGRSM